MSVVLALDTTGRGGAVAIARDGELVAEIRHDPSLGYAESLFGLCDEVLQKAGLRLDNLEAVAVVRGPGSYTGLRIGLMTAKSLAFARQLDLFTADTLPLVAAAASAQVQAESVLAVFEAGRDHAFASTFTSDGTLVRAVERVAYVDLADWCDPRGSLVVGYPTSVDQNDLSAIPDDIERVEVSSLATSLARAASTGSRPVTKTDPVSLVPAYVGVSQAEHARGLDLGDVVHRPVPPVEWE